MCPREVTKVPNVVVTVCLKAIKSISVLNCSYCLTIYAPNDSLNYHSTLNLSYFGSQKSAMKRIMIRKKPIFYITNLNR